MVTFRVPDMSCGHCASTIARAVAAVDRAARIEVSVADRLVSIASSAADAELAEAILEAGYASEMVTAQPAPASQRAGCCCGTRQTARAEPPSDCCGR